MENQQSMINKKINYLIALSIITTFTIGCSDSKETKQNLTTDLIDTNEVNNVNKWFNDVFERNLNESPEFLSYLGKKDRQGELDDISEKKALKDLERSKKDLEELNSFNFNKLDEQTKLSYRLFKRKLERSIEYSKYRHFNYPVNQMHGMQSELPSFMINMHKIADTTDAIAYISRLNHFKKQFEILIENLKIREEKGIIPPKFVFGHLFNECNNIIGDEDNIETNLFYEDFSNKISQIEISNEVRETLLSNLIHSIRESVIPGYKKLISYLNQLENKATTEDGVWKFPDGQNFYNYRLSEITTTNLSGDEIFNTGLEEVERIHNEIKEIMNKVKFQGDMKAFFSFMKTDKQFYYSDNEEGKKIMLDEYQAIVDTMEAHLDKVFLTKPKAKMQVKAVEEWREKSAGKAFYQRGTPDGKRKGTFYANLYKMADMPKYEMEALAYHEGIPGHHMQGSIAQELNNIPEFRKYSGYTAYSEGWGLYCELLPKEMGFYQDPYSDFGRLAMELWRACRLVVDVGIHQKKWTREQAIKYLIENTPNSENSCTKAIERYIVMPGQATAYKVGMLYILKVRSKAKNELREKFDIREFHDIFLRSGGVPLEIFEENINDWITKKNRL